MRYKETKRGAERKRGRVSKIKETGRVIEMECNKEK